MDEQAPNPAGTSNNTPKVKGATVASGVLNLVNTVIGAGVLGLPYAFYKAGLVPSILMFLLMYLISQVTFSYVVNVCDSTLVYSFGDV